mgnify:CR=1
MIDVLKALIGSLLATFFIWSYAYLILGLPQIMGGL